MKNEAGWSVGCDRWNINSERDASREDLRGLVERFSHMENINTVLAVEDDVTNEERQRCWKERNPIHKWFRSTYLFFIPYPFSETHTACRALKCTWKSDVPSGEKVWRLLYEMAVHKSNSVNLIYYTRSIT